MRKFPTHFPYHYFRDRIILELPRCDIRDIKRGKWRRLDTRLLPVMFLYSKFPPVLFEEVQVFMVKNWMVVRFVGNFQRNILTGEYLSTLQKVKVGGTRRAASSEVPGWGVKKPYTRKILATESVLKVDKMVLPACVSWRLPTGFWSPGNGPFACTVTSLKP